VCATEAVHSGSTFYNAWIAPPPQVQEICISSPMQLSADQTTAFFEPDAVSGFTGTMSSFTDVCIALGASLKETRVGSSAGIHLPFTVYSLPHG
jgi:hypothetical protein